MFSAFQYWELALKQSLVNFPKPKEKDSKWPWEGDILEISKTMPDGLAWPRISIVTPSYNQGQFIEETIRSVLLQGYPNLEYIVIDGGSTDGSVEIIKKYEPWLAYWVSEPDRGQSHAINKGWERASGEIVAYLCSDDIYFSNTLATVAMEFRNHSDIGMVTGGIAHADEYSNLLGDQFPKLPRIMPTDLTLLDPDSWFLPQASSFILRKTLSTIGAWVREDLHYTMDRELFYRAAHAAKVHVSNQVLATYRHHQKSKTTVELSEAYKELPRAFSYCEWGTPKEKKQRFLVLRKRIAEGYYYAGRSAPRKSAFRYLLQAALLRPEYIINRSFLINVIKRALAFNNS
jgi:glycosyltransferase involved in cell wall biosynthesis